MKYSVGQKVKIRSLEWYRDNVNRYGIIECGKYEFFEPMNEYCDKVVTIKRIDDDNYRIDTDKGAFCWTDEMIEGLVEDEIPLDKAGQMTDFEYEGLAYTLPEGYQFKDENGNVINATKIVLEKKKKEYPKSLEECCEVLDTGGYQIDYFVKPGEVYEYEKALITKISALYNLIICRDAYWQLYGEEMGLGKPWEPDWADTEIKYCIANSSVGIKKSNTYDFTRILSFPTKEMRDTFYENFKELIEQCKELL